MTPQGVASDLCFSLLARGGRRVDLIANSSLEKQALKQVRNCLLINNGHAEEAFID
jgi:hypothetical protein